MKLAASKSDTKATAHWNRREARLTERAFHCPDCNAEVLTQWAIELHKRRGTCVVIPGARAKAAARLVEYFREIGVLA